jgi:hypothetical protein
MKINFNLSLIYYVLIYVCYLNLIIFIDKLKYIKCIKFNIKLNRLNQLNQFLEKLFLFFI